MLCFLDFWQAARVVSLPYMRSTTCRFSAPVNLGLRVLFVWCKAASSHVFMRRALMSILNPYLSEPSRSWQQNRMEFGSGEAVVLSNERLTSYLKLLQMIRFGGGFKTPLVLKVFHFENLYPALPLHPNVTACSLLVQFHNGTQRRGRRCGPGFCLQVSRLGLAGKFQVR